MSWYFEALKKYAVFSGRSRRREYWFFTLVNMLVAIVLFVMQASSDGAPALSLTYLVGVLIPSYAVSVRRLHDTDRSGWWLLLGLIPVGGLVLIFFYLQDGTPGSNRYGDNPKSVSAPRA